MRTAALRITFGFGRHHRSLVAGGKNGQSIFAGVPAVDFHGACPDSNNARATRRTHATRRAGTGTRPEQRACGIRQGSGRGRCGGQSIGIVAESRTQFDLGRRWQTHTQHLTANQPVDRARRQTRGAHAGGRVWPGCGQCRAGCQTPRAADSCGASLCRCIVRTTTQAARRAGSGAGDASG